MEEINFDKIQDNFAKYKNVKSNLIFGKIPEKEKLISIVIPTYGRAEYLREALDSALNQDCDIDYEVVVVDNDSTRNTDTEKLLAEYHDERLLYYKNEKNIGMFANWNRCVELAPSEWIAMLHDDDLLKRDYVHSVSKIIKNKEYNISALMMDLEYINDKLKNHVKTIEKYIIKNDIYNVFVGGGAVLGMCIKKKDFIKQGGYNDEYYPISDSVFRYIIIKNLSTYYYNDVLYEYRILKNESMKYATQINVIKQHMELYDFICNKLNIMCKYEIVQHVGNSLVEYYQIYLHLTDTGAYEILKKLNIQDYDKAAYDKFYQKIYHCWIKNRIIIEEINASKIKNRSVCLFGAGMDGKKFYETYGHEIKIQYVIDNSHELHGKEFDNNLVVDDVEKLKEIKNPYIFVTTTKYYREICEQLDSLGFIYGKDYVPAHID